VPLRAGQFTEARHQVVRPDLSPSLSSTGFEAESKHFRFQCIDMFCFMLQFQTLWPNRCEGLDSLMTTEMGVVCGSCI